MAVYDRQRRARRALLSSVAFAAGLASTASPVHANEVYIGGVLCTDCVDDTTGKIFEYSMDKNKSVIVNIDTAPIGSALAPVSAFAVAVYAGGYQEVNATQDIAASLNAIWLDSFDLASSGMGATVNTSGTLTSSSGTALEVSEITGPVTIDGGDTGTVVADNYGIDADMIYGPVTISDFASVAGRELSVFAYATGDISIQGIAQVGNADSSGLGVEAISIYGGNIDIGGVKAIGSVTAYSRGISTSTYGSGMTTIRVNGDVDSGLDGINASGQEGKIAITVDGSAVETSHGTAIGATSTTGDISIAGTEGATLAGKLLGLDAKTGGGDITISGFGSITGSERALEATSGGGDIAITGNGLAGGIISTGGDGIHANGEKGNSSVLISGNGVISAGKNGIDARAFGTGTNTISLVDDVTGGTNGILARSQQGENTVTVDGATVTGFSGAAISTYSSTGKTTVTGSNGATLSGRALGLYTWTEGGDIVISGFDSVTAYGNGIVADSGGSDITITGNGLAGGITSTSNNAIIADTGESDGNILISGNGAITADEYAIMSSSWNLGWTRIETADNVTGGTWGINASSQQGDIEITVDGAEVRATQGTAIETDTIAGKTTITGRNGATLHATERGIRVDSAGGDIAISGFGAISSNDTAVDIYNGGGDVSVTGVGLNGGITSESGSGIRVYPTEPGGDILISGNGPITAHQGGIEAAATGKGTLTIAASRNVSGRGAGIFAATSQGSLDIDIAPDVTVTSDSDGGIGITTQAVNGGSATVDIAPHAMVQGKIAGLFLYADSGSTETRITNAGIIRNVDDTGASDDAPAAALLSAGTSVLDNSGFVVGALVSSGKAFTVNNLDGGAWYASTVNGFGASSDILNNAGTVFLRDGATSFDGLETFLNKAGGHVDMSYGAQATDSLAVVNLASESGARYTFDFDARAANNSGTGFDQTSSGLGTADTITVSGTVAPAAGTLVDINLVNGIPTSLTGSVSLIYTGIDLAAPEPGEAITASQYYAFGTATTLARTLYHLVDDGKGGLYLQWAPLATPRTLGGYFGGDLSQEDGSATSAAIIASAAAPFAAVGGIGGAGGPAGGGAASFVADRAASASARAGDLGRVANFSARRGGSGNNPSCGTGRPFQAWTQGGGGALSGGPARGERYAVSFGIERDLADMTGMACGQLAAGLFGGLGRAHSEWGTGTSDTASRVTGGYLNYVSENGFYMSALGAVSWSSTGIDNALFGSTAEQSSIGVAGIAAVGHVMPLTMDSAIDWRAYAAHGLVDGDGFTDTLGVVNDGSEARITTFGLSAAYRHGFSDRMRGFAQAGVKWARVDRKASAFGTAYRGATEALFGSVAAGFSDQLTAQASLAASIHADFSAGTIAYGGDVRFRLRF